MRITAIIPFLALASHPLIVCAQRLTGKVVLGAGPIRRDTDNQYCCVGVNGPGTAAYKYVEQYKDPSPAVGTNCEPYSFSVALGRLDARNLPPASPSPYVRQLLTPMNKTQGRSPTNGLCDDGAPNLVSCTDSFGV
ncbi:uncharacterized protein BO72DRAFT_500752 [Aspergillus fijiensis CBS 313.89]|uniref:Uncharacterized protein n=1 Tax=Aspergillus fijiensis CBS 313.89 TaxID=1448319 RepID=A0A8G1RGB1_9EURO|nr:uncharacterized protein BO72DRAFT_500752 [Aspergillus fijiensis CBS 313.89]RAK72714.1 hypothetical protein BO72DRAFT_500752 [Aspergillus fijiensis CBS 313.89]